MAGRNLRMAERIAATPVRYRFSFVFAGDSGAWPDPTAEAIFAQLVRQTAALEPAPLFFANLGDFAGPGTRERHERYVCGRRRAADPERLPDRQPRPRRPRRPKAWAEIHGPRNFDFPYGHTRFVVLDGAPARVGEIAVEGPEGVHGPDEAALAFLDSRLAGAEETHRVVLLHAPPRFGGRSAPHPEWGFACRSRSPRAGPSPAASCRASAGSASASERRGGGGVTAPARSERPYSASNQSKVRVTAFFQYL